MVSVSDIRRLMRPLSGRLKGMIRRATLGTLNTTSLAQSLQAGTTKDDEDDDVELFEPYGFTSGPPAGSEGIVLRVGGERAGSVAICFGNRTVRLAGVGQGEVAMYDDQGASVIIRQTGNIEVTPGPGGVVQLGGPTALLAVARQTDPVGASEAMAAWGLVIETAINALAPGTFTGANSFAGTVGADMGSILAGGTGATCT